MKSQGIYWNGVCEYPTGRASFCGVQVRKGARYCSEHGGFEPDERAKAKVRYENYRRRVQAQKVLKSFEENRNRAKQQEDTLKEAQSLFLRALRGEVGNYAVD